MSELAAGDVPAPPRTRFRRRLLGLLVLALVAALAALLGAAVAGRDGGRSASDEETGEIAAAVERAVLRPGRIELTVRNDGAEPLRIAQVIVNDAYVEFTSMHDEVRPSESSELTIDYPWVEDAAYEIEVLTSAGVVGHEITHAAETPTAEASARGGRNWPGQATLVAGGVGAVGVILAAASLLVLRRRRRRAPPFAVSTTSVAFNPPLRRSWFRVGVPPRVVRGAVVLAAALGGAVVALAVAAVVGRDDDARPAEAASARPASSRAATSRALSVREIFRRAAPGVVVIRAGESEVGTGFVIDEQGRIVTNYHVVQGADEVSVGFGDDDPVAADVVGADPSTDIALLDVDVPAGDLTALPLGELADVHVGDEVVAIGSPFGLDRTLTTGVVSGLGRRIEAPDGFPIRNVIQTDAALNSGNSGGPLLNLDGEVIGINSQIETRTGGNVGIGYAVPVDTIRTVVDRLLRDGEVKHAFLGIAMEENDDGVLVEEVQFGSPAADAGVREGDVITAAGGERADSPDDLADIVGERQPGDELELEIHRGDVEETVTVTLGERPS